MNKFALSTLPGPRGRLQVNSKTCQHLPDLTASVKNQDMVFSLSCEDWFAE